MFFQKNKDCPGFRFQKLWIDFRVHDLFSGQVFQLLGIWPEIGTLKIPSMPSLNSNLKLTRSSFSSIECLSRFSLSASRALECFECFLERFEPNSDEDLEREESSPDETSSLCCLRWDFLDERCGELESELERARLFSSLCLRLLLDLADLRWCRLCREDDVSLSDDDDADECLWRIEN